MKKTQKLNKKVGGRVGLMDSKKKNQTSKQKKLKSAG